MAGQRAFLVSYGLYFIFHFWSFEISEHILRNQNLIIGWGSYSRQRFIYLDPILIYISLWIDCLFEIHKIAACFPLAFVAKSIQGHWWGFLSRNVEVWPIYFLTKVFTALKGTHFCIFIGYRNVPKFSDRQVWANSADPDQTAPLQTAPWGAVWSGSTLFAIPSASFGLNTLW